MARPAFVLVLAAVLCVASPASAAVVINEVESDAPGGGSDWVEIYNTDAVNSVDVSNYVLKDSGNGNDVAVPGGSTIGPHGFLAVDVTGLGSADSARLFDAGQAHQLDAYSWTSHAYTTYGRCPDGTGAFVFQDSTTKGAANDCPPSAEAWPGSTAVTIGDDLNVFGQNLSGLAYQGSGSAARGALYAVRNSGTSAMYRLIYDGTKWAPDTANGWANGKQIFFTSGLGAPDAEGVTFAGGDATGIYVSSERDGGGASRPSILRYDITGSATTITASMEWDLSADLPVLGANLGPEAIAWVPDDVLVAKGFVDQATGLAYSPSTYPNHGSGLFFVGVEQDGKIYAYALDLSNGATFTRVASFASGFPTIMDLEYEPESGHLWAVCDDSCDGRTATLDVTGGQFVVSHTYARPAGMDNLNNEGFAIAPQSECVNSLKLTFYADDSNDGGHAVRTGLISCTVPAPPSGGGGGGSQPPPGGGGSQPPPDGGGGSTQPPGVNPPPDTTAPGLKLVLKLARRGTFAVRRTGKFGAKITLGERADLTITAAARKGRRSKFRTLLRVNRTGVAAGTRTFTLTLTQKARRALRKGETLRLTIRATDAAGNRRTQSVTGLVP